MGTCIRDAFAFWSRLHTGFTFETQYCKTWFPGSFLVQSLLQLRPRRVERLWTQTACSGALSDVLYNQDTGQARSKDRNFTGDIWKLIYVFLRGCFEAREAGKRTTVKYTGLNLNRVFGAQYTIITIRNPQNSIGNYIKAPKIQVHPETPKP